MKVINSKTYADSFLEVRVNVGGARGGLEIHFSHIFRLNELLQLRSIQSNHQLHIIYIYMIIRNASRKDKREQEGPGGSLGDALSDLLGQRGLVDLVHLIVVHHLEQLQCLKFPLV